MAGVGKTALALQVAHAVAGEFPDGLLYARLRNEDGAVKDSAEVLVRLLRALGERGEGMAAPDAPDRLDGLIHRCRTRTAGRRLLILLGDTAGELHIDALLPATTDVAVPVTSRNRPTAVPGSRPVLEPMGASESLALLAAIAGNNRIVVEPETADVILRACPVGMPSPTPGLAPAALRPSVPARFRGVTEKSERGGTRMTAWPADQMAAHGGVGILAVELLLPALEAALPVIGVLLPGRTAVVLGGMLAWQGHVTVEAALLTALAGAVLGNLAGYAVGRRWKGRVPAPLQARAGWAAMPWTAERVGISATRMPCAGTPSGPSGSSNAGAPARCSSAASPPSCGPWCRRCAGRCACPCAAVCCGPWSAAPCGPRRSCSSATSSGLPDPCDTTPTRRTRVTPPRRRPAQPLATAATYHGSHLPPATRHAGPDVPAPPTPAMPCRLTGPRTLRPARCAGGPTPNEWGQMNNDAIQLRSVSRSYGSGDSAVTALDQVSLSFPRATFTAVMGPSGSGKSTLLQCAAGLDRPTSGSVSVGDTELTKLSETKLTLLRRERIGFVFQAFNLLPALTAEQNVALPLRLAGKRVAKSRVREVLQQVGLGDRARHRPTEMSGGQQQRVALARALITRPEVLFGDEPTGALDSQTSREVLSLLRSMVDREGQTIIMVTHDPVAASYADRVVFLVDGRVNGELVGASADDIAARMTKLEAVPC
jgi:putative ABC transport system ATP-binding protein